MAEDALSKYNAKRDFNTTSEPAGEVAASQNGQLSFVIQKHAATRLHYDFRLELNGVLLSWAVPKGPSYYPGNKRLAVRTEDHPLSYRDFEGIIPARQYGAGPVMVWDTGTWEPLEEDPDKAIKKGKIRFRLSGQKLKGEWTLARMRGKEKSRENWLLMKVDDEDAISEDEPDFLTRTDFSAISDRAFSDIAAAIEAKEEPKKTSRVKTRKTSPDFATLEKKYHSPELATLAEAPPKGDDWVHEVKYDGYRILVYYIDKEVKIRTRNGHDWTAKFPRLCEAFQNLEIGSFVIDGEAVVIDSNGLSDFKGLQNALGEADAPMQAFFFDLLYENGNDYLQQPFTSRRQALESLFSQIPPNPLFLSQMVEGQASEVIGKACELGLEGIISKKKTAKYTQKRTKTWLKSKCESRQEFIICGYIPSTAMDDAIGSLHLGYHKDDELIYAGKVGTGFDQRHAKELFSKLEKLAVKSHPFAKKPDTRSSGTTWVRPELLCEVKFAMWTQTGKVRHASYQGMRADKPPENIVKETPTAPPARKRKVKKKGSVVAGVTISHPDRAIFPEAKVTKAELAEFYATMEPHIIPQLKKRPISVVRCPGGIDSQCFFQRTKGAGMPDNIHVAELERKNKAHEYFYINDVTGLVELVQMGSIEIHPWGATLDKIDTPDRIIFDLDPDEDIPFEAIKLAALEVRRRLEDVGLESFVKCTGGKGLHVMAPIQRTHDWATVKDFTRRVAQAMETDVPEAFTVNMSKKKRKGKIFVDYLRNDYASTAVVDYCVRARPGARVAVPLNWEELDDLRSANQFTITDVLTRKQNNQLFTYPELRQRLNKGILESF